MNIFMLVVMDDSRKRFRIDIMIIIGYPTRMFGVIYIWVDEIKNLNVGIYWWM